MFTTPGLAFLLSASALAASSSSSSSTSSGFLTTSLLFSADQTSGTLAASISDINNGGTTTMVLACPPSSLASRCAFTDDVVITVTEFTTGTSTKVFDVTFSTTTTSSSTSGFTANADAASTLHCEITGTTTGACTGLDAPATFTEPATTKDSSNMAATSITTLGPTDISMVPLIVTAGQQILASASSSSSAASAGNGQNVGSGVTGAFLAGVLGFAMMA